MAFHDSGNGKRARTDAGDPSEPEILRLVAQRESYRQARRFPESDAIREELRNLGIEVYDKEKEWRAKDGRRGSLFTAGPGECYLSDEEIANRIRQREDARSAKDWNASDSLRDELRAVGVELDDKKSVWRTAGGRTGTYRGGVAQPQGIGMQNSTIRKLVAERERFRANSDFESADEMRRQLAGMGVELFDSERIWKSSDGQRGVMITGGHEVDCHLSDYDIQSRVQQREEARSSKDWGLADSIRDGLRQHGVEMLDGQRLWVTTDGRQGSCRESAGQMPTIGMPHMHSPQMAMQHHPASMPMGGVIGMPTSNVTSSASPMTFTTDSIIALVAGREKARESRDFKAGDNIRNDLRAHGVDVWDKEKVWRANDGRSGPISR